MRVCVCACVELVVFAMALNSFLFLITYVYVPKYSPVAFCAWPGCVCGSLRSATPMRCHSGEKAAVASSTSATRNRRSTACTAVAKMQTFVRIRRRTHGTVQYVRESA